MADPVPAVLVIDNDAKIFASLQQHENELGIRALPASSLREGLEMSRENGCDVILMKDLLPDGASCYAVQDMLTLPHAPEIIIYATRGNPEHAELALKSGVWDYLIDPAPENSLAELVRRALRYHQGKKEELGDEENDLRRELASHGIIGRSKSIQNCLNLAAKISQSDANVLITGESGTGKELFANAIHNFSSRSQKSLTIVDCASLPSTLVESILFGHSKGSFTGADKSQQGLVKQADGGTLFLDEIGEMPLEIQKKLLRVIQERKYRPVGSTVEVKSDFRLIAATNRDLQAMAKEGDFREDLLFRLRTFQLELPPLRSRIADITELAYFYRDTFCRRRKLKKKKFSPDYLMILSQYEWPGNVRELFQAIERSITYAMESNTLYPKHLPIGIRVNVTKKKLEERGKTESGTEPVLPEPVPEYAMDPDTMPTLKEVRDRAIDAAEKKYLEQLLDRTEKNISRCCKIAGLSRSRFYDLLKKYQILK